MKKTVIHISLDVNFKIIIDFLIIRFGIQNRREKWHEQLECVILESGAIEGVRDTDVNNGNFRCIVQRKNLPIQLVSIDFWALW